jgi:hypothetical protein
MSKATIRISASRLQTLWDCTLKFWYQEILRLPDSTHWKTKVGSVTHLVFEVIMRKDRARRLALFRSIMETGRFSFADHPSLTRFVAWQLRRESIASQCTVADIEELLRVAWLGIRPHFISTVDGKVVYTPPPRYVNEHRFQITLASGAVISGFIDLLLVWEDRAVVIDLKTKAAKFTKADLPSNVQAAMYQLVCQREHGITPTVEFIMLRHGPTSRTPDKHIQRVEAPSIAVLQGLESYVDDVYRRVNQMNLEDALSSTCRDEGFCVRVCTHYAPHAYWLVCRADDPTGTEPISAHLVLDKAHEACEDGQMVIEKHHAGCIAKWRGTA